MTDLFDPNGPESRNLAAEAFEDQCVAMGPTLGWRFVCRNVDVVLKEGQPSRGIDILWSVPNAWDGKGDGWLLEAKRKKDQRRYSETELREEVQSLRDRVAGLRDSTRFYADETIRRGDVDRLVGGLLAHRNEDFNEEKVRRTFRGFDFVRNEEKGDPTRVLFFGPKTLIGIADVFNHHGRPARFLWPPSYRRLKRWTRSCSPDQLAAGLVAYRNEEGDNVLWVRGGLDKRAMPGFADLVYTWSEKFKVVAFTELNEDGRRFAADDWRRVAATANARTVGRLPVEIAALDCQLTMKEFDQLWPAVAA
jgi:hypothetical protein